MVNSEARINYLNKMVEFLTTDNQRNWRFRLTLAFQMNKVISLYTPEQVASHHTSIGNINISIKFNKKQHKNRAKKKSCAIFLG